MLVPKKGFNMDNKIRIFIFMAIISVLLTLMFSAFQNRGLGSIGIELSKESHKYREIYAYVIDKVYFE